MTTSYFTYVSSEELSDCSIWQSAIDRLKLECDLIIDPEFRLYEDEGICRCSFGTTNETAVFEICYTSADAAAMKFEPIAKSQSDFDNCIVLRCGDKPKNRAATLIAIGALANSFNTTILLDGKFHYAPKAILGDMDRSIAEINSSDLKRTSQSSIDKSKPHFEATSPIDIVS